MLAKNTTKPKKWDKLDEKLEVFIKENMNEKGELNKPLAELFREFADKHNTTVGSTSFYYYSNGVKERLFSSKEDDSSNDSFTVKEDVEHDTIKIDNEIERLVKHIEDTLNVSVSDKSLAMIRDMVLTKGVVSTLLSISKAIGDFESFDKSYIIIREAWLKTK